MVVDDPIVSNGQNIVIQFKIFKDPEISFRKSAVTAESGLVTRAMAGRGPGRRIGMEEVAIPALTKGRRKRSLY